MVKYVKRGEIMEIFLEAFKNYTKKPNLNMFTPHTHNNYEIFCFLSGDAKYFVEGNIYNLKPGDILIIKKSETHSLLIEKETPYVRYVINFNPEALLGDMDKSLIPLLDGKPLGKFNRIPSIDTKLDTWLSYLEKIVACEKFEEKRLYLTVLLNELCENLNVSEYAHTLKNSNDRIIEYINKNLSKITTLDEICNRFFISKTHLNRKFKTITGSTVWDYIVTKKMILAKELLSQGYKPNVVSEKCGYSEYSAFYRAYKSKFGASPMNDCKK